MFGGDNELGNMLQEAVKLKSAQINQKRKQYETWPFFVQHTLFHMEKEHIVSQRKLPFSEKMEAANKIKAEGTEAYKNSNWLDAVDRYEEAASLVHYCYSTDPGWRKNNRGIDDDVLVLVDDRGENEDDAAAQEKLRVTCALNIAACKLHLQKYEEVISACDAVLQLEPQSVKALYRRAEARIRPLRATAYDYDLAIKDLAKAHGIDPSNGTVTRLLGELRAERKVQREKDSKTFTGMFERGEIYDGEGDSCKGIAADSTGAMEGMENIRERIENITDEDSLEKRTADAELLRDLYMRNGKEDEARELNEKIKAAKKVLKDGPAKPKFDWETPSAEMIADAEKYGLDLKDPRIVQELKRIEAEEVGADGTLPAPPDGDESELKDDAPRSNNPLELPEVDLSEPVPWRRYFGLFGGMFVGFKILALGLPRKVILQLVPAMYGQLLMLLGVEDEAEL